MEEDILNVWINNRMKKLRKYPIWYTILLSEAIGIIIGIFYFSIIGKGGNLKDIISIIILSLILGIFLIYPIILTIINVIFLIWKTYDSKLLWISNKFEFITILLGFLYSGLILGFYEIQFKSNWTETLSNQQVHTPIWTTSYLTVIIISFVGILGYLILSWISLNKMPPLVIVSAIAAMYLGMLECSIWIIQIFSARHLLLCIFPLNCIIIMAKTIRIKILEWNLNRENQVKIFENKYLNFMNERLVNAYNWPIAAFLLMWPLLGIIICILVLFGQRPDSVIKAWTETSDWNLSQRVSPQNVYYDEHYLCTVAAGGHEKVVKPIRLGERHGHKVIVNRQLCVANAFEQIIEEQVPVFHKHLRHFYDTYGFPIAKIIHSKYTADIVYFIMKPLEWLFLIVLYFYDVNPENRIAIQYLPKQK